MYSKPFASEPKAETNPLSISQAVRFAWCSFKKRYAVFAAVLVTIFGAWIGLEIVVILGQGFGVLLWAVAHFAFLLFFATLEIGFLQMCLALYGGREAKFSDSFAPWSLGLQFLAGQIFFLLAVAIGLVLLVLPGLYIAARYGLFGFCMAAGEKNLIRSLQQSAILTAGTWINLLGIFAGLLFFNVLGAGMLGIGLFFTIPMSALISTALYRQLSLRGSV